MTNLPRIRRKKCDEKKPSCTPCLSTSRECEFSRPQTSAPRLTRSPNPNPHSSLPSSKSHHLDYFLQINIPESSIYFSPSWTTLLLQNTNTEPSIFHAVLAIGALSRTHYHPSPNSTETREFGLHQYNLAIQEAHKLLKRGKWEVLVLGSMLFVNLEVFMGWGNRVGMLLGGAKGILDNFKGKGEAVEILEGALKIIEGQFGGFKSFCM